MDSFNMDCSSKMTDGEIAEKYGIKESTVSALRQNEAARCAPSASPEQPQQQPQSKKGQQPVPEIITIKPQIYRPREHKEGQKQVQVLLLSDMHAGGLTASYNPDVFRQRVEQLYNAVTTIKSLHVKQHPIDELVIFSLGDQIQGENVGIQMSLDEYSMSVYKQCYNLWLPTMTEFIANLLSQYRTVTLYGVKGNHGVQRERKLTSRDNNWDCIAMESLRQATMGFKNFSMDFEPVSWYKIVEILGWKYFLLHGDVIGGRSWATMDKKTADWEVRFRPDAFCIGHFHTPGTSKPRNAPVVMNGTLKSDDEWSLGVTGKSGYPAQVTFGVHVERPISWFYTLDLT